MKTQYIGVNAVVRRTMALNIGGGGISRKVTKGFVGVAGIARQYFPSEQKASDLELGTEVYVTISGSRVPFIVVDNSHYTGIMLLAKNIYATMAFDSNGTLYFIQSDIFKWLNGTFYNSIGSVARARIVNSTFCTNYSYRGDYKTTCKVFLPSMYNMGFRNLNIISYEGPNWDYQSFQSALGVTWWSMSANVKGSGNAYYVLANGLDQHGSMENKRGIRPCFAISRDSIIDADMNVT